MKIKKEKKPFKREYIPIILAVLILFVLIAALIYLIGHDFKFDEETVDPNQAIQEEVLIDNSNSKCSKEELNELYKLAEKITTNTEMVEISSGTTEDDSTGEEVTLYTDVAEFTLSEVDSKLYAYITNDYNDDKSDVNVENGKLVFRGIPSFDIVTYNVEIKANDYDCKGETIRKFTLKSKIYNRFSQMADCLNYPEFKYCQQYIDEDLPTMQSFKIEIEKYKKTTKATDKTNQLSQSNKEEKKGETNKDNKEDNKNYKYYIIGGVAILLLTVAIITVILLKKKRSNQL